MCFLRRCLIVKNKSKSAVCSELFRIFSSQPFS
nr:MAG TPA: hypothetical protein [Caudoviricetes sp.]